MKKRNFLEHRDTGSVSGMYLEEYRWFIWHNTGLYSMWLNIDRMGRRKNHWHVNHNKRPKWKSDDKA